jgi:hypothetical protein
MEKYEVIPSRRWRHVSGKTASVYGAAPWVHSAEAADWHVEESGWTLVNPYNGEIGACRRPFATKEEAEKFAAEHRPSRLSFGD